MKARFMIEEPQKVDATMKITMSMEDWVSLRDQLNDSYPSWKFSGMISDLIIQARKVFYPTIEEKTNLE